MGRGIWFQKWDIGSYGNVDHAHNILIIQKCITRLPKDPSSMWNSHPLVCWT